MRFEGIASWCRYALQHPLVLALSLYLVVMVVIVLVKPRAIWDERRRRYRHFGTGREDTVYPLWAIALMLGVLCYSAATVLFWIYGRTEPSSMVTRPVAPSSQSIAPEAIVSAAPSTAITAPSRAPALASAPAPASASAPAMMIADAKRVRTNPQLSPNQVANAVVSGMNGGGRGDAAARRPQMHNIRVPQSQVWLDAIGD